MSGQNQERWLNCKVGLKTFCVTSPQSQQWQSFVWDPFGIRTAAYKFISFVLIAVNEDWFDLFQEYCSIKQA